MLLVAIAFGLLLTLEVLGFVLLHLKISALATELRRARTVDALAFELEGPPSLRHPTPLSRF